MNEIGGIMELIITKKLVMYIIEIENDFYQIEFSDDKKRFRGYVKVVEGKLDETIEYIRKSYGEEND